MFVIVRHGNTFEAGETPRRIGAATDLPLTVCGEQQADALGRHFAQLGWHFSRIMASPLRRTWQTAEHIAACQVAPPAIEMAAFLREIDHGVDENRPEGEVLARIGRDALDQWDRRAIAPPGWQVDPDTRIKAWRELFQSRIDAAGPVLLVTSNGAARFALVAHAFPDLSGPLKLPTGSFGVLDRTGSGGLAVRCWGERP